MTKTLYCWNIKCDNQCKNQHGITELNFVTESNVEPVVDCGPCGSKVMTDVTFVKTETITESV